MARYWALGLMSGTSMDGIDAALLLSDGKQVFTRGPALSRSYDPAFRARLRDAMGSRQTPKDLECELTLHHAAVVEELLAAAGLGAHEVAYIGFHGQTIAHAPEEGFTLQMGDGALLARKSGIAVVSDFRSLDVSQGGEGAPLAPLYHAALARDLARPLAVLNIGGVSNVTWIGRGEDEVIAFDCGPGGALLDDWVLKCSAKSFDDEGRMAARGKVSSSALAGLMDDPYFERRAPKSLDRDYFDPSPVAVLSPEDGAATLTAFSVAAVHAGMKLMPEPPRRWLVTGGGRHNRTIMQGLADALKVPVEPVEAVGWDGDHLEAEAFAYLALRCSLNLPTSLPGTTGAPRPLCGGRIDRPNAGK